MIDVNEIQYELCERKMKMKREQRRKRGKIRGDEDSEGKGEEKNVEKKHRKPLKEVKRNIITNEKMTSLIKTR